MPLVKTSFSYRYHPKLPPHATMTIFQENTPKGLILRFIPKLNYAVKIVRNNKSGNKNIFTLSHEIICLSWMMLWG